MTHSIVSEILHKLKAKAFTRSLSILRNVYRARFLDDKMMKLLFQNKGASFFLSTSGHELIGVVAASVLTVKKDWAYPYHRDRSFVIGLGASLVDLLAIFLGRAAKHHSGSRMMPEHFCDRDLRILCQSSCVGSQLLQAVGTAKAIALNNLDEVVYVSIGDGGTSQGDFHEALNFSSIHNLPIVFVVQDNGFAISVPVSEQTAGDSIADVAAGYRNLAIFKANGLNFLDSFTAMEKAVSWARSRKGPSLVVAKVVRLNSHSASDDQKKYKSVALLEEEKELDPIPLFENYLLKEGIITKEAIEEMKKEVRLEIEEAALEADKLPLLQKEHTIFIPFNIPPSEVKRGEPISMIDALNRALYEEMERDEGVIVFGEDVAHNKGGVFGVTKGLTAKFGNDRCFNTPLAESTIIGAAIGLSMDGKHKPVVEIQYADYIWSGINQLVNELASIYYRSNEEWHCPVVVRMSYGGYVQGGPYHSQCPEAVFCHTPGLKVVVPSNSADAKMLLKSAIRDPNPVIFLEHKALYRAQGFPMQSEPLGSDSLLPFGKANIVKEGSDVTVVAWGMALVMAYDVAQKSKLSIEVIDLRTLIPLDMETILNSIEKTGRVIVFHEAVKTSGFGAEIVARIMEEGFSYLKMPAKRVAAKDCPIPYAKNLENEILPQKSDLEKAVLSLCE